MVFGQNGTSSAADTSFFFFVAFVATSLLSRLFPPRLAGLLLQLLLLFAFVATLSSAQTILAPGDDTICGIGGSSSPSSCVPGGGAVAERPKGYNPYTLLESWNVSHDSKILRFALPPSLPSLGLTPASSVKVKKLFAREDGTTVTADKSYSPVSLPNQTGYFELLVKGYPPRPKDHPAGLHGEAGGLGAWLVSLKPGETADMDLKKDRIMHGAPYTANRWAEMGMVAGGTGIAPMLHVIRSVLANPEDKTKLSLVFANREEKDILVRDELDGFAKSNPDQFRVHYVLSSPPENNWTGGGPGWVKAADLGNGRLPAPGTPNAMILVCGRDEFLVTVSGMTTRGAPKPGEKKGPKIQGNLTGLLKEMGYKEDEVFKF